MTFTRNTMDVTENFSNEKDQNINKSQDAELFKSREIIISTPYSGRFQLCKIYCCIVFGSITLLLGVLSFRYTLFSLFMAERMRMTPGLPPFEWWLEPKAEVICKTHLFTVTNPTEFLTGIDTKIKIQEFTPIIYREKIKHFDVIFHSNSTLTYTIKREVEFVPEMNEPDILNATIIVPNIVLLGMATVANTYSISVKFAFNMISKNDPVFVNTTVYNYLWNFTTPTLEIVKKYVPFMVPQDNGGVMFNVYENFEDRINVNVGNEHGYGQFFKINTFNGRSTAPGYLPEKGDCNASIANSTEGAQYPTFIKKDDVIYYWRKTVCRAIPLHFEKELYKNSIKAYKFIARTSLYDRFEDSNADCHKGFHGNILPNGLSDISKCYHDLPIAVSAPHFYGRTGYWTDHLEGFSPSKEKHGSYSILEPIVGVPLEQVARSQSNLIMPKIRNFNAHVNRFSNMVIPMLWMEYSQENLPPEIEALVFFTVNILPYLQYVISVIIVLTGLFYLHVGVKRIKIILKYRNMSAIDTLDISKSNKC